MLPRPAAPTTGHTAPPRRLGTGRCQGGFDMTRVTEILARELGLSPLEITKKGSGSYMLARPTKVLGDHDES